MFEKRRQRKEEFERMCSVTEDFLSMSLGARMMLSVYDRLSDTGFWGNITESFIFGRGGAGLMLQGGGTIEVRPDYRTEFIHAFAYQDYQEHKASGNAEAFSSTSWKEKFFNEDRLRNLTTEEGDKVPVEEITADEWTLLANKYIQYVTSYEEKRLIYGSVF